jgi:hypothetical protein
VGVILPNVQNPWSVSLDPQRADLWLLDIGPAITSMLATARANGATPNWLISTNDLKFQARSVTLPNRQVAAQQVRLDNAIGQFPGNNQAGGQMQVVFVHDANQDLTGTGFYNSQLSLALEIWRAMVRAGQGFSYTGQGGERIPVFTLEQASDRGLGGYSLIPNYAHDLTVTLLRGCGANEDLFTTDEGDDGEPNQRLATAAKYLVKQAWLGDFQLGELSYENGNRLLEIRASFYINDYHLLPK